MGRELTQLGKSCRLRSEARRGHVGRARSRCGVCFRSHAENQWLVQCDDRPRRAAGRALSPRSRRVTRFSDQPKGCVNRQGCADQGRDARFLGKRACGRGHLRRRVGSRVRPRGGASDGGCIGPRRAPRRNKRRLPQSRRSRHLSGSVLAESDFSSGPAVSRSSSLRLGSPPATARKPTGRDRRRGRPRLWLRWRVRMPGRSIGFRRESCSAELRPGRPRCRPYGGRGLGNRLAYPVQLWSGL